MKNISIISEEPFFSFSFMRRIFLKPIAIFKSRKRKDDFFSPKERSDFEEYFASQKNILKFLDC